MKDLLLALQYRGRAITWSSNFPHAEHWVLLTGEQEPAGRIVLAETPSALRCVDLAVLPQLGGRGIATAALRQAQERAQAAGQTLALRVGKHSPALHLYLRLGFKPATEDDLAFEMFWDGAPFA